MFTPAMNGKKGRAPVQVKNFYYPEQFKSMKDDAVEFDFGVLDVAEDLQEVNGYLGIDVGKRNVENIKEVQICGYPGDKEPHTMWFASGSCKNITATFLKYRIPTELGQSGSPIIKREGKKQFVIGIHIGSNPKCTRNIGVRLTSEKRKMINEWVGEVTGKLNLAKQFLRDERIRYLVEEKWLNKLTSLDLCTERNMQKRTQLQMKD